MAYRLRYLAHDMELPVGDFVVGRSTECQLALDDPLVSRRHAMIRVRHDGLTVEDLGSRNGVMVNGVRLMGPRELSVGDKIGVGSQEMELYSATDSSRTSGEDIYRRATQTLGASDVVDLRNVVEGLAAPAPPNLSVRSALMAEESGKPASRPVFSEPTSLRSPESAMGETLRTLQSFQLLGGVADKALALGKAEEAERILQTVLTDVITRAREGTSIDPNLTDPAVRYAVRLASATGKPLWVEYVFELYRLQRRVLPAPVVDELYAGARKMKGGDLSSIRAYLETLREMASSFGPADRFLLQRIEGLERQMALK